jgi:hypothetical protein
MALFWLPSANYRAPCEALLRAAFARIAGYLVTESTIQHGRPYRDVGQRSQGFSLMGFLHCPAWLTRGEWLHRWLDQHTYVALETQASFRYVQNAVTRRLTDDAPALDALVEEGFPLNVLTSQHAFYGAEGDDEKFQRHYDRMMASLQRFVDFDNLNSFPTSEYLIGE